MKTYRKLWYKAKIGDGHILDDGISIWTTFWNAVWLAACGIGNTARGRFRLAGTRFKEAWQVIKHRYSHEETWWPDLAGDFESIDYGEHIWCGECFTSTVRGKINGTVIRPASEVLKNVHRWDCTEITVSDEEFEDAKFWAKIQAFFNVGYSKKMIGSFFVPVRSTYVKDVYVPKQIICSVAGQGFDWKAGLFKRWRKWSPLLHWLHIDRMGYETKPLITKGS